MKNKLVRAGKMLITLVLLIAIVTDVFINPQSWPSYVCLTAVLCIWTIISYETIEGLKIGIKDFFIEILGKNTGASHKNQSNNKPKSRVNEEKNDVSEKAIVTNKIDFHEKFSSIQLPPGDVQIIGEYRTPTGLDGFAKLIQQAKEENYNLEEDNAYLDLASSFQRDVVNQLLVSMENYNFNFADEEKYRNILFDALYESDFDMSTFKSVKAKLVAQLGHEKLITHRFDRALNDLKKIKA